MNDGPKVAFRRPPPKENAGRLGLPVAGLRIHS
jgi:hypothetical protein